MFTPEWLINVKIGSKIIKTLGPMTLTAVSGSAANLVWSDYSKDPNFSFEVCLTPEAKIYRKGLK
jgi:hypothetical protein